LGSISRPAAPIKIGFVLLSNTRDPIPSTRIAVLNMLPYLRAANYDPYIVFEPEAGTETPDLHELGPRLIAEGYRIVFFQKVHGTSALSLVRQLNEAGVRTVYGVCDRVNVPMAQLTDATIVVTDFLKSLYPHELHSRIAVVHDGIENPHVCKENWQAHGGSATEPLSAVLVTSARLTRLPVLGSPPDWLRVSIVGRYPPVQERLRRLQETRWTLAQQPAAERLPYLRFLLSRRIQRRAWNLQSVYDSLREADLGIIPIEMPDGGTLEGGQPPWKVKSENRLTMKMSIGLAVVATPIPAYEAVIEQGVNGFLAKTRADWLRHLEALRDPDLRRAIGQRARESVRERYSMDQQARLLLGTLDRLVGRSAPVVTEDAVTTRPRGDVMAGPAA
jgi:glycosyltransferase involved in cell wall biosynthesis